MLTQETVLQQIRDGRNPGAIDGRDFSRLCDFFPADQWPIMGCSLKEGVDAPTPKPWTREAVIEQLTRDLAFGFEKAIDQRGISASCMYEVVKMWMWVLDDELQHFNDYPQYGLPLFKAVAAKFNLPDPLGADKGNESKYEMA